MQKFELFICMNLLLKDQILVGVIENLKQIPYP